MGVLVTETRSACFFRFELELESDPRRTAAGLLGSRRGTRSRKGAGEGTPLAAQDADEGTPLATWRDLD